MKWVLRGVLGLVALFVVAVAGAAIFVSTIDEKFVEDQALEATGRALTIGQMELNLLSASPSVTIENLRFANAPWAETSDLAAIERLDAQIELMPLLSGILDVTRVELRGATIAVEVDENGRSSADFAADRPASAPAAEDAGDTAAPPRADAPGGGILPVLRLVDIQDVTVTQRDARTGQINTVRLDALSIRGSAPGAPLDVEISGSANELPIAVTGQLGAPEAMLDPSQVWPIQLSGDAAGISLQVDGEIQDPAAGRGIDLIVALAGDELADAAQLAGIDVPTVGAFDVQAAVTGDADGQLAVPNLNVLIGKPDFVRVELTGSIASATTVEGVNLSLLAEGLETASLSPVAERFAGQSIPALGPYRLTAAIQGGQADGLSIRDMNFALGRADLLVVNAQGVVENAMEAAGISIGFAVQTPEVDRLNPVIKPFLDQAAAGGADLGPLGEHGLPAFGPVTVQGAVTGGLEAGLALSDLNVSAGRQAQLAITVTGGVSDLMGAGGIDLAVTANSAEVGALSPLAETYAGQSVPALGPLAAGARIQGDLAGTVQVQDLSLDLGAAETIRVTASGGIADALNQRGIDIAIGAESMQVGALSPLAEQFAGQKVPALGPLSLSATVAGDMDSSVGVNGINLSLGDPSLIRVTATGGLQDALNQKGLNLSIAAESRQIGALSPIAEDFAGQKVPALGPLAVKATVTGDPAGALALGGLNLTLGGPEVVRVAVTGGVADLLNQSGIDIALQAEGTETGNLSPIAQDFAGQSVPALGPFSVAANIKGALASAFAVDGLDVRVGSQEKALLAVQGAIADAVALTGVDVTVSVDSPTLADLGTPEAPLPDVGPIRVRGQAQGSLTDELRVNGLTLQMGDSDVAGSLIARTEGERPSVNLALTSNFLDLSPFQQTGGAGRQGGAAGSGGAGGGGGQAAPASSDGRVIPADPLPLDAMKAVDADVTVKVARLKLAVTEMTGADVAISLKNGDLQISPFRANAAGGLVDADLRLNASKEIPELGFRLNGDNLDIGGVMQLAGINDVVNGPLKIDVSVAALGDSPRALASTLGGSAKILVTNGQMNRSAMIREFGQGATLITQILFANKENVVVECMIADYAFRGGVAETKAGVLETEISTVTVDGSINLGRETLDLDVTPQGSIAGAVQIGIPVAVGGTLANPTFGLQAGRAALGAGLGLLTGGAVPALGAILGQGVGDDHPCANLKTGGASGGVQPATPSAQPVQPVEQQPIDPRNPEEAVKNLLNKGLKGLFGN